MIETDEQRRWWFATHPEYSWSRRGIRNRKDKEEEKQSQRVSPKAVDAYVDEALTQLDGPITAFFKAIKRLFGTEGNSQKRGESGHAAEFGGTDPFVGPPATPNPFNAIRDMLEYFERNHPVFMDDPSQSREQARQALERTAEIARVAEQIASGHAYDKHVVEGSEYPMVTERRQFQDLIFKILSNPTEWKPLEGGRSGYWDDETGTVVIRDPKHPDGGTAFRPKTGKRYYDKEIR